ncbi:MAG: molybdopterin-dependent oxidoreductase, partial [Deltaproteobacteria bacterium]|nr:molybdopterin-dependent oxidoreductase [Deltaproteobacteria bacterium]
ELHPLQKTFVEEGALQCGFCGPGMLMSAKALLDRNANPTEGDVHNALAGNLCRCTGYTKIINAVLHSALETGPSDKENQQERAGKACTSRGQQGPDSMPADRVAGGALRGGSVGKRVTRADSVPQVLGALNYVEDLSFAGTLRAKVLRSAHAHARILHVDVEEAARVPGVKAVLTGREIPVNSFGPHAQDQPVLAGDKVRHLGDAVAAVAAVSEQIAEEALSRIRVEYEVLPAVFDPLDAMREDAPKVHEPHGNVYNSWRIEKGDVEKALSKAHLVLEERYTSQMVDHAYLEPHAMVASWDAWGRLTVWSSLGRITLVRGDLARTLNLPISRIRVVSTQAGGCFGGKNEITLEPVAALLSKKTGRPVKIVYTRTEEFTSTTKRHPFVMDYVSGVEKNGRITARKVRIVADGGAYHSWTETALGKGTILSAGPYRIDNLLIESCAVYTNKTMAGAFRGFGAPQVCFAYESHMDSIARRLAMDPLEIRLLNSLEEGALSATGQKLHSVVLRDTLRAAASQFGWRRDENR